MGRIGQGIARRGAGFGMKVLYHNRSQLPAATEAEVGATYVDLDTLLAQSDHLLLVLPYTPASHHLIDAAALAKMKPSATLVNIARGGLVDEIALADALANGRLAAAGLDVYEGEPKVRPELLALRNVVLTRTSAVPRWPRARRWYSWPWIICLPGSAWTAARRGCRARSTLTRRWPRA